jgi:hypothetical protein
MATIEARAVISAQDKTGGTFQKIAGQFKEIAKSAKALNDIKPVKGVGLGLSDETIAKFKLTQKQIDQVRRSYESFVTTLRSGGPVKASRYFEAMDIWTSKTLADLRKVRSAMEETERRQSRMFKGVAGGARFAAGAIGVGGAAYLANRGARSTVGAGASAMREDARDYLAGMTPEDSLRIKRGAMGLSGQYNSIDATTLHERLRDTSMSMRSTDKALELGDTIARGQVVMQSLVGKDRATEQGRHFFKGLDTLGKNMDPAEVRTLFDGYVKAQGVEGNDMSIGDLLKVAKLSKSAGATLDNRFLMTVAPGLMQDMDPSRLGTALGSSMSQIIGGRATGKSKEVQQEYGLRDAKGRFKDSGEMMSNPFDYAMNRLIPALQKKGVNVDDNIAVTKATSQLFSNQIVADLFNKMITQREQYRAKGDQYGRAPGLAAATELGARDPFVAAEGFVAQLRNMAASLAEPAFPLATKVLGGLSKAMATLSQTYSEETGVGKASMLGIGGLAAGAAGYKGLKMAQGAYQWFTGAGALNGSAALLSKSAAELTAAAAVIARGSVAGTAAASAAGAAASPAASAAAGAGGASIWSKAGAIAAIPFGPAIAGAAAVLAGGMIIGAVKDTAGTSGLTGAEAAKKASGGSRLDHLRKSFDDDRARFGLSPTQANQEPVKAEVEGNATLTGEITVAPSAYFMTTIDQRIDNRINAFKATNITSRGTAGSTGRSSPDASAAP